MTICYFTASGNSLYVARRIGGNLLSIPKLMRQEKIEIEDDADSIICPVYAAELPIMVMDFMRTAEIRTEYFFFVLTCGDRFDIVLGHAEQAAQAAKTLENAGFECSSIQCDLGSKEDILNLVEFATSKGEVTNVVNAAGVSPSQAPVDEILRVDLYGTSVLLEEFGKVIAEGGSGVIISSQSGHRLPALPQEQNDALAVTPVDELLELPFLKEINDTLKAYQSSKRCNVLRVMFEATRWGRRGATVNSISPGIIITPLANDELHGPRKEGYLKMIDGMPARRAGTPDEVGDLSEFLMSSRGRFISGADFLIDGGCTASYWYGDLQYLKATH